MEMTAKDGSSPRPHTVIPAPSIQQYSDELRRALSARFAAVAEAGRNAPLPPPEVRSEDPDYGYDEDPFDTRAKLLMSLKPKPEPSQPPPRPEHHQTPQEESFFDLTSDTELEQPYSRRWSTLSHTQSVSWFDGASTPSSEVSHFSDTSFEVGRASDWINLYGRSRISTPPVGSRPTSITSLQSVTIPTQMLGTPSSLRPLSMLTPSPQPAARRFRRRAAPSRPYDIDSKSSTPSSPYEPPVIARTTSEAMILAAGLASQRERRRGGVKA